MQLGIEKQENIRQGVDLIATRAKEFLEALNKIAADKIDIDIYKDNLDDAIEGTRDAMNDAEKAKKSGRPTPSPSQKLTSLVGAGLAPPGHGVLPFLCASLRTLCPLW